MNISLLLNIITFILVTNHMLEKPETVDNVLLAFLSGVVLMWLLFRLGIGIGIEGEGQTRRLSLFGENPNMIGNKAVIAFTIVLYFLFVAKKGSRRRLMSRIFLLVLVLILFSLVMATGSRGAFIAFFISSLFVLYVLEVRRIYKIILVVFTVLISIYIWNQIMYGESIMQRRLMEIVEERSYGHRGELLEYGLVTFTKNPIFGVGSIYKPSESEFRDPHNVFVYVLLTSGLMGFVPFVFFNYIILMRGYRTYKHKNNILCLILFFSLVLIMAKSGGFISKKLLWITYAFISGAAISNNITNISQEN
ncbi:MAG: O-antigen ligase family protein [Bacteroidales bacterium]|nr:O-antigen ligase family protein [Bacteroidales bacterium]